MINSFIKCIKSFRFAIKGLLFVIANENNMRYHIMAAALTIGLGFYFNISDLHWFVIIMLIGLVIMAETINTAIEKLSDQIRPERDPKIGLIKDISAGAVLIISITAAIIGCMIFLPLIF